MGYFKDRWKDGFRTFEGSKIGFNENHNGYIEIYEPNHPNSKSNGWIKEHRYVMAEYIGRPLRENEVVHHKNKWKKDNRIQNLELLDKKTHDNINYRHLNDEPVYCYLCGSDKTYMNKNTPNWNFDIDNKIVCGKCYGYIHSRYKIQKRGIKPRKEPKKYIPVFESRILVVFTISNSNNTVTTIFN